MPFQPLSTFPRKDHGASLTIDEDEDEDYKDYKDYKPYPADEDSSGQNASSEAYFAEGSPGRSDADLKEEQSSAEEHSSSAKEYQGQHTSSAKPTRTSAPKRKVGLLESTRSRALPGSSRRPRNSATYNVIALSRKARGYTDSSPKKKHTRNVPSQALDLGSRRRSEPPTYNLKELVQQTRGRPKIIRQLTKKTIRRPAKRVVSVGDQNRGPDRKRPESDESDDGGVSSKRRRIASDTSFADDFTSEGPDVTGLAIRSGDYASDPNPNAPALWKDGATFPGFPGSSGLWQYISKWLVNSGSLDAIDITDDERILKMLALPQNRAIEWNHSGRIRWSVNGKIDIVALLLQVIGEESPSPCDRCTSDPGHSQWLGCMTMPSELADEAWRLYGCANCVYHGQQTYCSLKRWNRERALKQAVSAPSALTTQEKSHNGGAHACTVKGREHSEGSPVADITENTSKTAQNCGAGRPMHQNESGAAMQPKPDKRHDTSLLSTGRSVDTLTIEPWEKAPGRIRSQAADTMQNIAFSKSYLASGREISVCKEATFRIEVIRSGNVLETKPQRSTIRLCSIATGKLTIRMDGEEPFTIGSHGMFRISPGSGCLVENEIYDDVTLHITSIKVEDD